MSRVGTICLVLVVAGGCGTLRTEETPSYSLHGEGFADPANPDYHGAFLRSSNYDFSTCQTCHGIDFGGGTTGVPCARCHPGGPTACTTCHGTPPTSGAHLPHTPRVPCPTCHVVPDRYDAPGHLDGDGKAEVVFSGLAVHAGAMPVYQDGRCNGVYCHGATLRPGTLTTPGWNDGPAAAACGTCHAVPPPNHYGDRCTACHAEVLNDSGELINPALHVDGTIQVRDLSQGCSSCHGPPQDIGGSHSAHLGSGPVGRAVECTECHIVPATIGAPGHLDTQPGAEINFGSLARKGGSMPAWDGARCTNSYCHGATLPGGTNRTPQWGAGSGQVACGSCHGVPMPNHFGDRCGDCHGAVVDRSNRIMRPDLHINGEVNLGAVP